MRVARKFQDELTLNNLSRPQLVSLSKFMNLNAFGTDTFLRHQIERRLVYLRQDDQMIATEGVDSLDIYELQQACLSRGIRAVGVSPARMRSELGQWLDLHLIHKVPSTLLLLSHAFQTTERLPVSQDEALKNKAEALQQTLSSLPHQAVNETQLKISEQEGKATYKQKLDVLKEQEELIADELEQDEAQEAVKKQKAEEVKKKAEETKKMEEEVKKKVEETKKMEEEVKKMADDVKNQDEIKNEERTQSTEEIKVSTAPTLAETIEAVKAQNTPLPQQFHAMIEAASPNPDIASQMMEVVEQQVEDVEGRLTEEELKNLAEVLKTITKDSAVDDVRKFVQDLKDDRQEFKEDIEELKQVTQTEPVKVSDRLGSRVDKMISSIEAELAKYDSEIGSKLNLVQTNEEGQISISDLEEALKIIRDRPNDDRIKKIVTQLDGDNDGMVAMNEILSLVQENEGHGEVLDKTDKPKEKAD